MLRSACQSSGRGNGSTITFVARAEAVVKGDDKIGKNELYVFRDFRVGFSALWTIDWPVPRPSNRETLSIQYCVLSVWGEAGLNAQCPILNTEYSIYRAPRFTSTAGTVDAMIHRSRRMLRWSMYIMSISTRFS